MDPVGGDEAPGLLLMTLVRAAPDRERDDAVRRFRGGLRAALGSADGSAAGYDVVPDANDRWTGGGIDLVAFATPGGRDAAAPLVVGAKADLPADPAVSFRAFAVEDNVVRPSPAEGVHLFSSGAMADGFDRPAWQARWRAHAALLDATTTFSSHLTGYVQHHGVDTATAARLGLDDTHGVAHMTYRSVEEQAFALSLPEYLEVLRPDEDQFVARHRGMRVHVARTE